MTTSAQDQTRLKYSSVNVLATAEISSQAIAQLHQGDAFEITRQVGLFYAVSLPDGREGFVFMRNVSGVHLPDEAPAATVATAPRPTDSPRRGIRGWLQFLAGQ
jgi:hypothetical protein